MAKVFSSSPRPRQRYPRVPLQARVVGEGLEWRSHNVSEGGLFVTGDALLQPGTELDFGLWLPAANDEIEVTGRARVVWQNDPSRARSESHLPAGMGWEVIRITPRHRRVLQETLYQKLNPAEVDLDGESPASGTEEEVLETGVVVGAYRILELVGQGGMAHVYRAEHVQLGRQVALKRLHDRYVNDGVQVRRFFDEGRLVNKVSHPNVLTITDFINHPRDKCYVMEWLAGRPLSEVSAESGQLPLGEVVSIGIEICEGMQAVHDAGIVHRDLKPGNVILLDAGQSHDGKRVKLVDFGIAKRLDDTRGRHIALDATQPGVLVGTPYYMSPEQALGEALDIRSDIYSFGVLLYQLITGRPVFDGDTWTDVLMQHARDKPLPLRDLRPGVPQELEDLVLACLAKRPSDRPATARKAASVLRRLGSTLGQGAALRASRQLPLSRTRTTSRRALRVKRSRRLAWSASIAGTLTLSGLVWVSHAVPAGGDTPEPSSKPILAAPASEASTTVLSRSQAPPSTGAEAPEQRQVSARPLSAETPAAGPSPPPGDTEPAPSAAEPAPPSKPATSSGSTSPTTAERASARKRKRRPARSNDPEAELARAAGLIRAGYTRQAIRVAQNILKRDSQQGRAFRLLGIGYSILGDTRLACEAYRRYLLTTPDAPDRPKVKEILRACR